MNNENITAENTPGLAPTVELTLQQANLVAIFGAPSLLYFDAVADIIVAISPQGMLGVDASDPQIMGFAAQVLAPAGAPLHPIAIQRYVTAAMHQFDLTQVIGNIDPSKIPVKLIYHKDVSISDDITSTAVLICIKLEDAIYQTAVDVLRAQVAAIDRIEEAHTRAFIAGSSTANGETKH